MMDVQKVYLIGDRSSLHDVIAIGDICMTGSFRLEVNDGMLGKSGDGFHEFGASALAYKYMPRNSSTRPICKRKEDPRELCRKFLKIETSHESLLHCELANNPPPGIDLNLDIIIEINKMVMTLDSTNQLKGRYKWGLSSK